MSKYFIEIAYSDNVTYFQLVRRSDRAILFANRSFSLVVGRLYAPVRVWEDGSPVVL